MKLIVVPQITRQQTDRIGGFEVAIPLANSEMSREGLASVKDSPLRKARPLLLVPVIARRFLLLSTDIAFGERAFPLVVSIEHPVGEGRL